MHSVVTLSAPISDSVRPAMQNTPRRQFKNLLSPFSNRYKRVTWLGCQFKLNLRGSSTTNVIKIISDTSV